MIVCNCDNSACILRGRTVELTCHQVAQWAIKGTNCISARTGGETLFVEDLVFVHRPTVDFSSGRSARRENNLLPSNLLILVTTTIITGTLKGRQRGRIQHPRFREAPRQISSSFVLPFARCQLMNSVCLGRRADKHTDARYRYTCISELSSPQVAHFDPGICSLFPSRKASFG